MPTPRDILSLLSKTRPEQPLSTDALAQRAGWSPAHFHRDFRAVACETPKQWSTRVRLAHAVRLLCQTDAPIHDVARQAGFASHAVFTRTVRRVLGTTPSAIRAGGAALQLQRAPCLSLYHLSLTPRSPTMPPTVTLVQRPAQPILFQRRRVAHDGLQAALAACLPAVFAHCQQHGVVMTGPPFTRYVEVSRGHFVIEAGMPVAVAVAADGIEAGELPGGTLAVAIHEGPYDTLGETHSAVEAWVAQSAHTTGGPAWETYLTDPGTEPDPAKWRTEVCAPVG